MNGLSFLESLINYERRALDYGERVFDPAKITRALGMGGALPLPYKIIHIAGTKGKGSTAAYCAELLRLSGYKTGLFTSPHLLTLNERIAVNNVPITDASLENLIDTHKDILIELGLTYFEALTFLACIYYARTGCQWVVLETGMGGRLDATNFCLPVVSVITPVSYDHTKYLGNTLAEIAREKAGIIKPGVPVVISPQPDEALRVIDETARGNGSPFFPLARIAEYTTTERCADGSVSDIRIAVNNIRIKLARLNIRQPGDIFIVNFLTALSSVIAAGIVPGETAIREAAAILIPGRMERIGDFILDVSHNDISFEALFAALGTYFKLEKYDLHIGILADKEIGRVAEVILKYKDAFRNVTVFDFETGSVRKSGGRQLLPLLKNILNIGYSPSPEEIRFKEGAAHVMTGSFYGYPFLRKIALDRVSKS